MYDDENCHILIQEVGPRDGLQNEPVVLSPAERAELIGALTDAGLKRIQIGSFVNPRKVPQMANTEKVWDLLSKRNGVRYLSPGLLDQLRSICVKVPDLAPLIDQTIQRIPEFLDTLRSVASKPLVSEAMSPDLDLSLKNANLAVGSVEARVRSRTGFFFLSRGKGSHLPTSVSQHPTRCFSQEIRMVRIHNGGRLKAT